MATSPPIRTYIMFLFFIGSLKVVISDNNPWDLKSIKKLFKDCQLYQTWETCFDVFILKRKMEIIETHCTSILTRTSGYLKDVSSHSLNPYVGCGYGNSSCGVGCYVRSNQWILRGRTWGDFVDIKVNADEVYSLTVQTERRWALGKGISFSIFFSSSTDPWQPIERKFRITRRLLNQMLKQPPDKLILQTHSSIIVEDIEIIVALKHLCDLRIHLSIEGDRDSLPGLPPPPCSVNQRIKLVEKLTSRGITTIVCMSPLYPLIDPDRFFSQLTKAGASAVVIDHFIEGDGTQNGSRTYRTPLPSAIKLIDEEALELSYRDSIASIARNYLPVGISSTGFAGIYSS
jgi:DNA repair photolyase